MMERTAATRRHNDFHKALRKRALCGDSWYNNLHQYSKNKIHCSCSLCAAKSRKDNWSISDLRKIQRSEYERC